MLSIIKLNLLNINQLNARELYRNFTQQDVSAVNDSGRLPLDFKVEFFRHGEPCECDT